MGPDEDDAISEKSRRTLREWLRRERVWHTRDDEKWEPEPEEVAACTDREHFDPETYTRRGRISGTYEKMLADAMDRTATDHAEVYRRMMEAMREPIATRTTRAKTAPRPGISWILDDEPEDEVTFTEEEWPEGPYTEITQLDGEPGVYPHRVRLRDGFGHWWDADQIGEGRFNNFAKWRAE